MVEQGGNGYSPKGSNSAEKSPAHVGKDDSSGKENGKKVQFDSEDGKGEKIAKGGKKTEEKALRVENPRPEQGIPKKSTCLMDSEAAETLLAIQDQMALLSQDPDIKLPVSFDMGLSYAKRDGNYTKPQTIMKIFEPLKKHGVSDCEICLIANICPESVDEVFALLPALKPKMREIREPLRIALDELSNLKEALANLKGWV